MTSDRSMLMPKQRRSGSLAPWLIVAAMLFYLGSSHQAVQTNTHYQKLRTLLPYQPEEKPAFHFLIAQSHRTDALCYQLQLFAQYGYPEPVITMFTGVWPDWIAANKQKIPSTLEYLNRHTKPNDIVMFLDGGDVHPQSSFDEMLATFNAQDKDWILAVERDCWPLEKEKFCTDSPVSPLEGKEMYGPLKGQIGRNMPNHMSGGHYIGRAGTIARAHERMQRELATPRWPDLAIDQILLQFLYWEGLSNMTADSYNDFFLPLNNMTPQDYTMEVEPGRPRALVRSNWSGRRPHTVHYSGAYTKERMANETKSEPSNLSGWPEIPPAVRYEDGSRQFLTELCPGYPISVPASV